MLDTKRVWELLTTYHEIGDDFLPEERQVIRTKLVEPSAAALAPFLDQPLTALALAAAWDAVLGVSLDGDFPEAFAQAYPFCVVGETEKAEAAEMRALQMKAKDDLVAAVQQATLKLQELRDFGIKARTLGELLLESPLTVYKVALD